MPRQLDDWIDITSGLDDWQDITTDMPDLNFSSLIHKRLPLADKLVTDQFGGEINLKDIRRKIRANPPIQQVGGEGFDYAGPEGPIYTKKPTNLGEDYPEMDELRAPTTSEKWISGGLGVVPAIGGAIVGGGPLGGIIGANIGSEMKQRYEIEHGLRRDYNPGVTALDTALGGFGGFVKHPGVGATTGQVAKYLGLNAAEGAGINIASTPFYNVAEGQEALPSLGQITESGLIGAAFGAGTAGIGHGLSKIGRTQAASTGARPVFGQDTPPAIHGPEIGPYGTGEGQGRLPLGIDLPLNEPVQQRLPIKQPKQIDIYDFINQIESQYPYEPRVESPTEVQQNLDLSGGNLFDTATPKSIQQTPFRPPPTPAAAPEIPRPTTTTPPARPMGDVSVKPGEDVTVNAGVENNDKFVANMLEGGYKFLGRTPDGLKSIFRHVSRLGPEDQGAIDPNNELSVRVYKWAYDKLRNALGREPSAAELDATVEEEQRVRGPRMGEETGRVASFPEIEPQGPITHQPEIGGYQTHKRGGKLYVTHAQDPGKIYGPFNSIEEEMDWITSDQDKRFGPGDVIEYGGESELHPDDRPNKVPGPYDGPTMRSVIDAIARSQQGRPRLGMADEAATGPTEIVPGLHEPTPTPEGQQQLPLGPLRERARLERIGNADINTDVGMLREPPRQPSMIDQLIDQEAGDYMRDQGIDPSGRGGINIPPSNEPSFQRTRDEDYPRDPRELTGGADRWVKTLRDAELERAAQYEAEGRTREANDIKERWNSYTNEEPEQIVQELTKNYAAYPEVLQRAAQIYGEQRLSAITDNYHRLGEELEQVIDWGYESGAIQAEEAGVTHPQTREFNRKYNEISNLGRLARAKYERASMRQIYPETRPPYDEPQYARVKGGGLTASVNIRRAVENITRDYTSPLPAVMNREGVQNALDAADLLGEGGEVRVRFSSPDNTMEIHDNGRGLDEDALANKLIEIFATGKEGEEGATGGKGIGSASYIYGGERFDIETTAVDKTDGVKYTIRAGGTPDQFLDPIHGSDFEKVAVPEDTPTGTTIKVTLKPEQDLGEGVNMVNKIVNHSRNRQARVLVDKYGDSIGTPLKDASLDDFHEYKFGSSKDDKMVGDFVTTNRNSQTQVLIPKYDATQAREYFDVHYLNNGMYQFTDRMSAGETAKGVPERVIVDIHPLVDDLDDLYPFINTREDIKKDIRDEVTKFISESISKPAVSKKKNRIQELYDSMPEISVIGTRRKPVIFDPGNRLTPDETKALTSNAVIHQLIRLYDGTIANILNATGRQKWEERLEGVGIVLDPSMHGVHIPNPATKKSTILINPFEYIASETDPGTAAWNNTITQLHEVAHIGSEHSTPIKLNPEDLRDARVGSFLASYMDQLIKHGDVNTWLGTGHGMDFVHRLGEVYAKFGVRQSYLTAARIKAILTGGGKSGGYSSEVQRLLHLYQESRGRDATTEDLLSGTGVKQSNRGPDTEGNIPGDSTSDGTGALATLVRMLGDEQGATPLSNITGMWGKFKESTGIGQGVPGQKKSKLNPDEYSVLREMVALPAAATTTGDLSPMGRQGLALINTPQFWTAAYKAAQSLHYDTWKKVDNAVRSQRLHQKSYNPTTGKWNPSAAERMGIKLFVPASEPGPRAEAVASRWIETGAFLGPETIYGVKNPVRAGYNKSLGMGVRATNRFYISFLNHLMTNRGEYLMDRAQDMSVEALKTGEARPGIFKQKFTAQEARDLDPYRNDVRAREIGDFVRTATGQAPLKTHLLPHKSWELNFEQSADKLGAVLFSPGLLASRVRMLNPNTYVMASPYVRKQYAKAAIGAAMGYSAFMGMAKVAAEATDTDHEIVTDITNSDFGKFRIGNTRLDAGGGFLQFMVLLGRMGYGGWTSSSNPEEGMHRFGEGYQPETQLSNLTRFGSNKLNPVAKFAWDVFDAAENKPFQVGDRAAQLFVPLFAQDLIELAQENPELLPWALPVGFGVGTQTYSKGTSQGKFINPENDWTVTGGGLADFIPGRGASQFGY